MPNSANSLSAEMRGVGGTGAVGLVAAAVSLPVSLDDCTNSGAAVGERTEAESILDLRLTIFLRTVSII